MSAAPLEYVGSIHIFLGPYRGNPVALYLRRNGERVAISPKVYPFNSVVGEAETPNKAAADFEEKWKAKGLVAADMYNGPSWEGGIKPERPAPPKPPGTGAAVAPAAPAGKPAGEVPPIAPKPATAPAGTTVAPTAQPVPAQPSTGTTKVAASAPSPSAGPAPSPDKPAAPLPGSSETPTATSVAVPGEPASKPSSS